MGKKATLLLWLKRGIGIPLCLLMLLTIGKATVLIMFVNQLGAEHALPQPIPMPDLPDDLENLPTSARIKCSGVMSADSASGPDQDLVNVWTYPATFPSPPDDSVFNWTPSGVRGALQGQVPRCTYVQITEYAWSSIDGEFYVKIQESTMPPPEQAGKSGQRMSSRQTSGWMPFRLLDFPQSLQDEL